MVGSRHLNKNERIILALLYKERRPMSIREISKRTGISWITVKKYLKTLQSKGVLVGG
ncbi:MAG: winged helix-turn-helix domain-containing protein [Candidatus Aenigmarchaeota archaeon]|nr:winged helix-turn-helix domain-containing protein [Candidatus Aenigmarchaeota archaeon]